MMILSVHRADPQYEREFAHIELVNVCALGYVVEFYFNVVEEWSRFIKEYEEVFEMNYSRGLTHKMEPSMRVSIVEMPPNFWLTFDSRDFRFEQERIEIGDVLATLQT